VAGTRGAWSRRLAWGGIWYLRPLAICGLSAWVLRLLGTGHSDMCGCKKCSHGARAKPKPPRDGPSPKAGAKKKGGEKRYGR
jgi:hypothetical protein